MTIDLSKLKAGNRVILESSPDNIYKISSIEPFHCNGSNELDYEIHFTNGYFGLYRRNGESFSDSIVGIL